MKTNAGSLRVVVFLIAAALLAGSSGGCGPREASPTGVPNGNGKLSVYVVNYPLRYFAERIGGELVQAHFPAPADEDPAFWKPDAEIISQYQQADLILLNGADYAKWVKLASLPRAKMVDTSLAAREKYIQIDETVTHQHGPSGEHSHSGIAFTTWLDFQIAAQEADAVYAALLQRLPQQRGLLEENHRALRAELEQLDREMQAVAQRLANEPLFASHPVYQYLIARYGLNITSLHWEPDQTPDAEQWSQFDSLRKQHSAKWMMWEGPPREETVQALRERGIECLLFDPCGNTPENADFITVMRQNLAQLTTAIPPKISGNEPSS